jgi:protocatechuate 3,4-dioxygenase beta subunit
VKAKLHHLTRREALVALRGAAAAGAVFAAGCETSPLNPSDSSSSNSGSSSSTCAVAPSETAGPYPDKTGMLGNQAFYRRDITEGRPGLPLTLAITITNVNNNCAPLANAAVEVWQCDASGHYSEYAQQGYDGTGLTYLRGLQTTDANGKVTFNTVYPGWYQGRATHIHVEVYVNGRSVKVTQIAFPESVSAAVYGTGVYAAKGQSTTSNASDNVFSDGVSEQLATVAGDTTSGYTAAITFGVNI